MVRTLAILINVAHTLHVLLSLISNTHYTNNLNFTNQISILTSTLCSLPNIHERTFSFHINFYSPWWICTKS